MVEEIEIFEEEKKGFSNINIAYGAPRAFSGRKVKENLGEKEYEKRMPHVHADMVSTMSGYPLTTR